MTRSTPNFVAALAAVAIMLATFVPVVTVPPAEAQVLVAAPILA